VGLIDVDSIRRADYGLLAAELVAHFPGPRVGCQCATHDGIFYA
jgi:hypothetical protein